MTPQDELEDNERDTSCTSAASYTSETPDAYRKFHKQTDLDQLSPKQAPSVYQHKSQEQESEAIPQCLALNDRKKSLESHIMVDKIAPEVVSSHDLGDLKPIDSEAGQSLKNLNNKPSSELKIEDDDTKHGIEEPNGEQWNAQEDASASPNVANSNDVESPESEELQSAKIDSNETEQAQIASSEVNRKSETLPTDDANITDAMAPQTMTITDKIETVSEPNIPLESSEQSSETENLSESIHTNSQVVPISTTDPEVTRSSSPHPSPTKANPSSSRYATQLSTIATLTAQKEALLQTLSTLSGLSEHLPPGTDPANIDESTALAAANAITQRHIKLLHSYNEIRDVGMGLMGLISDGRGVRVKKVQEEFGIEAKD